MERIAFPLDLVAIGLQLLRNETAYAEAVAHSQQIAREQLSFTAVAAQLRRVLG